METAERLVPREDPEAGRLLAESVAEDGVLVLTARGVERVEVGESGSGALLIGTERIAYDRLLVAVGRAPDSEGLGLERVGAERTGDGWLKADDRLRTTAPHVYAAGDAVGEPMYTHVAGYHGVVAALNALFHGRRRIDHRAIPRIVLTQRWAPWE